MYLLEMEVEALGDDSQFGHILFQTSWMRTDEVGDDLLMQVLFLIDAIEDTLEIVELLEGGFSHESQDPVAGVLGSHLQSATDVTADKFPSILACSLVGIIVRAMVEQQVIAHTTSDEALLDARDTVYSMIDVEQTSMAGVKVGTDGRMDATGPTALLAGSLVASSHTVHIGRGPSEVGEVTLEVGHGHHLSHLF